MTTPAGTPGTTLKFSDLALEYTGNASTKISMSEIGYGGNYNKRNSCSDLARTDSTIPFHSLVANLPVYNGPNSNIKISLFYSKDVYAAPPDGAISISNNQTNYDFTSLFEIGRNYNPNQNKRSSPLFQHVTNNAAIYATTTANWGGVIRTSSNAIMYLKNNGGIYGCGGNGGNGQSGRDSGYNAPGGAGGPALLSEIYTILDNSGVIYGGGNGGAGGAGGHVSWNECYGCSSTNSGGGGGGGGGGQSYQVTSGGSGGGAGANFGDAGSGGGGGNVNVPGAGGGGGDGGRGGNNGGAGGAGGAWGGGDSYIGVSGGKNISGTSGLLGYTTLPKAASSLSGAPNLSGTYGNGGDRGQTCYKGTCYDAGYFVSCNGCDGNPVSNYTWYNYSPTTVSWYGSGLVVNVIRYPNGLTGPDGIDGSCGKGGCRYYSCGTCTYYWSYTVSIVSGGSGYIPARSIIQINVDGNAFNLTVY